MNKWWPNQEAAQEGWRELQSSRIWSAYVRMLDLLWVRFLLPICTSPTARTRTGSGGTKKSEEVLVGGGLWEARTAQFAADVTLSSQLAWQPSNVATRARFSWTNQLLRIACLLPFVNCAKSPQAERFEPYCQTEIDNQTLHTASGRIFIYFVCPPTPSSREDNSQNNGQTSCQERQQHVVARPCAGKVQRYHARQVEHAGKDAQVGQGQQGQQGQGCRCWCCWCCDPNGGNNQATPPDEAARELCCGGWQR